jgi:hypothetical protein
MSKTVALPLMTRPSICFHSTSDHVIVMDGAPAAGAAAAAPEWGVLALASRCIVLMYKVAICHSST